jgi:hypothetical protein
MKDDDDNIGTGLNFWENIIKNMAIRLFKL